MTSLSCGTALPCLFTVVTVNSHRFPLFTNKSSNGECVETLSVNENTEIGEFTLIN